MGTLQRLVIAYLLITLVVVISDRSKAVAGIVATAPINIPIVLWILWGKSNGDGAAMQTTVGSMLIGIFGTGLFLIVCWYGFRHRWPFPATIAGGYAAWALAIYGPQLVGHLVRRR